MSAPDLRTMLTQMVPFIRTVGISIDAIGRGTASATLPARPEINNHLGTAHAGAVYTLGESASGGAVLSIFGDLLPGLFVALKSSQVKHSKAVAGDVLATASIAEDTDALRKTYEETGKVDFDVHVALTVNDEPTAEVTYTWAVRAPR